MKTVAILAALACVAATSRACAEEYTQPHDQYAAAINNESNHQYYVLITVADERSGIEKTGCVLSNFLLGAIHREQGLGYDSASKARTRKMALSQNNHRFSFQSADALRNLSFERFGASSEDICKVVREGKLAYRPHNQPQAVAIDRRFEGRQ